MKMAKIKINCSNSINGAVHHLTRLNGKLMSPVKSPIVRHIAASPLTNTARAGPRAAINPPSMIEPLHPISLITGIDIIPANEAI